MTRVFHGWYIPSMAWEVEFTDEFGKWWDSLDFNRGPGGASKAIAEKLDAKGVQPVQSGLGPLKNGDAARGDGRRWLDQRSKALQKRKRRVAAACRA